MAEEKKEKITQEMSQYELEEQYMKSLESIEEGQVVSGAVIQVNAEHVFVDVGYKSEGKISISEFDETPKVGDRVDVVLIRKEGEEGSIVVSKRKADEKTFWKNLKDAHSSKEPFEGTIARIIKGGYEVDLGFDVTGFLPLSKADVRRIEDDALKDLVGQKSHFMVERVYSNGKVNIILSRRGWLEIQSSRNRKRFFEETQIGDEVEGVVKSFTSFGAFIDLGGFDGLLHINDMSWGHVNSPKEAVTLGDAMTFKVIRLDPEENRINLSLKHFTEDPWASFEDRYQLDDVVRGKVTKLTSFGAFIELEEGIEGLAHISELSWVRRIRHPKEILHSGDEVDVKILAYDITQGKVSLGVKQLHANPWSDIESRFPVGMRIKRKVKNLSNFGAFFELEEGIDGLLHLDDFSWTKQPKHPSEVLKEGEETEIMVIDIDKENQKIKLGLKQLSEDPWKSLRKAYRKGSIIEGVVSGIAEFGVFVKVQGDIEGLISNGNLCDTDTENLDEVKGKLKEGEAIKAVVAEISPSRQKLSLSRKDYFKQMHKEEIARYMHDGSSEEKVTLGDLIKDKSAE